MPYAKQFDTSVLPPEISDIPVEDLLDISFQKPDGCQVKVSNDGGVFTRFYSYKEWGGVRKAVNAAISRRRQLKALSKPAPEHRELERRTSPFEGVSWGCHRDKRRGRDVWRYQVFWRRCGKLKNKTFSLGSDFTADQRLHAYRTAIQFLHEYIMYGITFDAEKYRYWRTLRLYKEGTPPVPLDMWRSADGEPVTLRVMAPAYIKELEAEALQKAHDEKAAAIAIVVEQMKLQGISVEDLRST